LIIVTPVNFILLIWKFYIFIEAYPIAAPAMWLIDVPLYAAMFCTLVAALRLRVIPAEEQMLKAEIRH
jgi:hypothetical protein